MPTSITRSKGVAMMLYGVPGVGKTRLIGTSDSALIIRPPTDHTDSIEDPAGIEEQVVRDWDDMESIKRELHQGLHEKYKWAWLDSISLFQEYGLGDLFAVAVAGKPSRAQFGPDQPEYGTNFWRLAEWVRGMVGLADEGLLHFGMTGHPMEKFNPVTKEDVWLPYLQGKNMSEKICGYCTIVAYLQRVEVEGKAQRQLLSDAPGHIGVDKFDCFPELQSGRHGILDPTMDKIEKAIQSKRPAQARRAKPRAGRRRRAKAAA